MTLLKRLFIVFIYLFIFIFFLSDFSHYYFQKFVLEIVLTLTQKKKIIKNKKMCFNSYFC